MPHAPSLRVLEVGAPSPTAGSGGFTAPALDVSPSPNLPPELTNEPSSGGFFFKSRHMPKPSYALTVGGY